MNEYRMSYLERLLSGNVEPRVINKTIIHCVEFSSRTIFKLEIVKKKIQTLNVWKSNNYHFKNPSKKHGHTCNWVTNEERKRKSSFLLTTYWRVKMKSLSGQNLHPLNRKGRSGLGDRDRDIYRERGKERDWKESKLTHSFFPQRNQN